MAIKGGEESLRALHWGESSCKFTPCGTAWTGRLLELLAHCREQCDSCCSREHQTHRETLKIHWFYLIKPVTAPASPLTNCLQSHPSVSGAADGLFSPKASPQGEELAGCASGAHPMGAAAAVGRFCLEEEQRGRRGAGCGTHPQPPPAPQPWRLLLTAGELHQSWRGLLWVEVLFSLPRRSKWRWSYNLCNFSSNQGEICSCL